MNQWNKSAVTQRCARMGVLQPYLCGGRISNSRARLVVSASAHAHYQYIFYDHVTHWCTTYYTTRANIRAVRVATALWFGQLNDVVCWWHGACCIDVIACSPPKSYCMFIFYFWRCGCVRLCICSFTLVVASFVNKQKHDMETIQKKHGDI